MSTSHTTKRICVMTSTHYAFDTRIFHKECKSLVKAGHEVTLVAPHERDEVVDGIQIRAFPKPVNRLTRMTYTVKQIYQKVIKLNADIYHFHDPDLIPVGILLRAKGRKVIYDVHEDYPAAIRNKYYIPSYLRKPVAKLIEYIEDVGCCWFSALVLASPFVAKRYAVLNSKSVLVQNFPLLDELFPQDEISWSQRICSIAYVGVISELRGIRQMVEAMDLLPGSLPATLKLAGHFVPADLREKVTRLPGWKHVEELGFLDRVGMREVLREVNAGLLLFHPAPNHNENQPNKLFEYMSAGIPVIASDFPLWRQIIQNANCGLLVDPLDSAAIAEAIEYILTHPQEAEFMGKNGRDAIKNHYNWPNEEENLLQLYNDLV